MKLFVKLNIYYSTDINYIFFFSFLKFHRFVSLIPLNSYFSYEPAKPQVQLTISYYFNFLRQEDKNSINKQLKYKQKFGIFQFYKFFVRNYRIARTKCPFLGTKANIFTGTFLSSFQNIYKCKFGRNKINVTNFLLTNLHFIATFVFFTMHKSISSKMILS